VTNLWPIVLLVAFGVGLWLWARGRAVRARIDVNEGKVAIVRGELNASMKRDIQQAVRLAGFRDGKIRLILVKDGLDVRIAPSDEGLSQRLRNIVRTWSI
jgi:hypothetical protein